MPSVKATAYLSPTLVLLAYDWPDGATSPDFLGFAIKRTPGFYDPKTKKFAPSTWLPNRIGFNGPPPKGQPDFPSNEAPIQKFWWWDARLDGLGSGNQVKYEITPVVGAPGALQLQAADSTELTLSLPQHTEKGIGTWFNRAVVSSQAFSRILDDLGLDPQQAPPADKTLQLRKWLSDGLEAPVPDFLGQAPEVVGAIYHLTDQLWIIPAFESTSQHHSVGLVYDAHTSKNPKTKATIPSPNQPVVDELGDRIAFHPRTKTHIMHDKFLVGGAGVANGGSAKPDTVVCGSANYTTEGLTEQANLMHTFDSPALAQLYFERFTEIQDDPKLADIRPKASWSDIVTVGDAGLRIFFSPEGEGKRESINRIVEAIHSCRSSVLFCLFDPTDKELLDACFAAGDNGKLMLGLVNSITTPKKEASDPTIRSDELANLLLYHRSKENRDVIPAAHFLPGATPKGFEPELRMFPGEKAPPYPPVIIHHKFIVIDGETEAPLIYSGSANLSKNSANFNDENTLEIRGSKRLAGIYIAEFLRLYEHYRARAFAIKTGNNQAGGFELTKDRSWAKKYFVAGSPEAKTRANMLGIV